MRSGKDLLAASKQFVVEDRKRSWYEVLLTLALGAICLAGTTLMDLPLIVRAAFSFACAMMYVRLFVIYHDYEHRAILQNSTAASWVMKAIGIYLLAPENIWKRSHEHHHNHNSKLTINGIGSYPTICKDRYQRLTKNERRIYLMNRHPLTIIFGYVTLFIYWLNLKSFAQSPSRHVDSLVALIFHFVVGGFLWYSFGLTFFFLTWFFPFFLAFAIGSYLFYCQHNFPGAKFEENEHWTYVGAALDSTSFMKMNPVMHWVTGNIGYHHVHHLNSRIPFYRLPEVMESFPELQNPPTTSWNPIEVFKCFQLKLWDPEKDTMITLSELKK